VGAAGPDSAHILLGSCSDDRSARLWQLPLSDLLQQQVQVALGAQPAAAAAAAGAESAHPLQATATLWGHTARVWDLAFLVGHNRQAVTACLSSSSSSSSSSNNSSSSSDSSSSEGSSHSSAGRLLVATGSEDCSCCLWDAGTGQQVGVLKVRRQQL
jgi:WD40 repeat protein